MPRAGGRAQEGTKRRTTVERDGAVLYENRGSDSRKKQDKAPAAPVCMGKGEEVVEVISYTITTTSTVPELCGALIFGHRWEVNKEATYYRCSRCCVVQRVGRVGKIVYWGHL